MFRRIASAVVVITLTSIVAYGAEPSDGIRTGGSAFEGGPSPVLPSVVTWHPPTRNALKPSRGAVLPAFYASLAALQAFDGYSTTRALAGGATEANPVMRQVVSRPAVFWSIKATMAVAPALAAERMWKTNKMGAIAIMAVSNGMMAVVAANNARVLNRVR